MRSKWIIAGLLASSLASLSQAQTPYKSLNYLYSISGTRTLSGQHNREPNSNPAQSTEQIRSVTGKYPALWSGDFLFQADNIANRGTMIAQARTQWNNGALINIMWHACNPALSEPCGWDSNGVLSRLSDAQWTQLITDGTALNTSWKRRMDAVAVHLQQLKDAGVEVFFRPLHEMNQPVFWWAGRPGPNGTRRLFQITRDYLRNTKGLTNLIWVWDLQDFGSLSSDLVNYNPGAGYWDVLALDNYNSDGQGFSTAKYNAMVAAAGGKPIVLGEVSKLPTPAILAAQPRWAFFMGWSELVFSSNTTAQIQTLYNDPRVITRDEMPGWNTTNPPPPPSPNLAYGRPVTVSSTESSSYPGSNAVDANGNTRWASAFANNQNFIIDLGSNRSITRVRIAWEAAYARDFQIQTSTDNVTWTTIRSTWGNTSLTTDYSGLSATARYVKIYCINRATSYGFSIYECEVY